MAVVAIVLPPPLNRQSNARHGTNMRATYVVVYFRTRKLYNIFKVPRNWICIPQMLVVKRLWLLGAYFLLSAYFAVGFIVYLLSASPAVFQSIAHRSCLL